MDLEPCPTCGAMVAPNTLSTDLCPACLLNGILTDDDAPSGDALSDVLDNGSRLGPFEIVRSLGHGGMAAVYEARELRLPRAVALKVLPPEFLHDDSFSYRFEQEARVLAGLEHPNIVPIYASGIDEGLPWVSMRLLPGGTLSDLLRRDAPLPVGRAVQILSGVAKALDYAHSRGVIHRDIKPSNILLDSDGNVCVADFGVAHMLERDAGITATGVVVGTPQYMAPEQALGLQVDPSCDRYSLGIVAYEMLTGAPPFVASQPIPCLMKHVKEPVPTPDRRLVSRQLATVLKRALAKNPVERWPTATAFVEALEDQAGNGSKRHLWPWIASVGAVLACALVAYVVVPGGIVVESPPLLQPRQVNIVDQLSEFKPDLRPIRPPARPGEVLTRVTSDPISVDPSRENVTSTTSVSSNPTTTFKPPIESAAQESHSKPVEAEVAPSPAASPPVIIREAVITDTVEPIYPPMARAAALEGAVIVAADCGIDGRVTNVEVLRSANRILDEAATEAVRRYQCRPATRDGVPEVSRLRVPPIVFRMKD